MPSHLHERFVPLVLSLSGIQKITDEERAKENPELAILSSMAHARDPYPAKSARIALLAQMAGLALGPDRSALYCDMVLHSLPEAARRALQAMDTSKYEHQSEFARRYFEEGPVADVRLGRAEIVLKLLITRYGMLSLAVAARVYGASSADLHRIAQRVLTAQTLDEALGTLIGAPSSPLVDG
jgi:hypothetical protein